MDSDPLTGAEMAKNNKNYDEKKSTSIGLNFVMCCLCAVSVVTSGYNSWNESNFKSKINSLEQRVFYLEERLFENAPLGGNLQRVDEIRNRVIRDLASKNQQHMQKDEPECSCPAGELQKKIKKNNDILMSIHLDEFQQLLFGNYPELIWLHFHCDFFLFCS